MGAERSSAKSSENEHQSIMVFGHSPVLFLCTICTAEEDHEDPSSIFKVVDANSDGKLSLEEFTGKGYLKAELEQYDADKDSALTLAEFTEFHKTDAVNDKEMLAKKKKKGKTSGSSSGKVDPAHREALVALYEQVDPSKVDSV